MAAPVVHDILIAANSFTQCRVLRSVIGLLIRNRDHLVCTSSDSARFFFEQQCVTSDETYATALQVETSAVEFVNESSKNSRTETLIQTNSRS